MPTLDRINELLLAHSENPFDVLREHGVQAELRELLLEEFPDRIPVKILQPHMPARFEWAGQQHTKRVQLEMKVRLEPGETVERGRTDLIVFRNSLPVEDHVALTCCRNGPGDILATVRVQDVEVAIEIKASPSRTPEQRKKYAADLRRLLDQNERGVEAFFVLIDKAHPRFGKISTRPGTTVDMQDWEGLRKFVPDGVSITTDRPAKWTAIASMCFLDRNGRPARVFVWR
ncbi:MAG: hypothetical protein HZB72_13490 [Burkholderiales bacterium]|nr:hypothetical protein [Burkholderiales bacterium]